MRKSIINLKTWLPCCAISALVSAAYLRWLMKGTAFQPFTWSIIFLYLWLIFSLIVYAAVYRFILPRLEDYSGAWKKTILVGYLGFGVWLAHNIPVEAPHATQVPYSSAFVKIFFLAGVGTGLGLALLVLTLFVIDLGNAPTSPPRTSRFRWAFFALPMLIIWGVYLLAYWPGMMSADSMDQWGQVLTGEYNNHHPFFHTFTIWLLTRIVLFPSIVAIAQIVALAAVAGWILAYFEKQGVPTTLLWLASFLFALTPVNGTMVNTLWKDIPYSTSFLALSFLVFRTAASRGSWLAERWSWIILGITGALVALFRYNGVPVVLGVILLLGISYFRRWKPLLSALLLGMVIYYIFTGLAYRLVQVSESTTVVDSSSTFYSIAAQSTPGSVNEQIMESISPLATSMQCNLFTEVEAHQQELQQEQITLTTGEEVKNLFKFLPNIFLYSYRCNRSLVWMIYDPAGEVRNTAHVEVLVDPNPYGLKPESMFPVLRDNISTFVIRTAYDPELSWLVWRPALYLYLFLMVIAGLTIKQKNPWFLLSAAPILLQSIASTLIVIAPNFRYHYAAYLLAWIFWPIIFAPREAHGQPSEA